MSTPVVRVITRNVVINHTTAEWAARGAFVLLPGEVGIETDNNGKVIGFKVGKLDDQIGTRWDALSYCFIKKGEGTDSIIQVTDPTNFDHTINTCLGAYSAGFGDRNSIGQYASECLVAGGRIVQEGQNGFSWGYRCENYANQTQVGGYKVYSYSSESLLVGNQIQAGVPGDIDITIDPETGEVDISSLSRYNVILGNKMFFGTETKFVFAFGQEVRKSGTTPIVGAKHGVFLCSGSRVRDNTEFIYAIGHNAFIGEDSENIVVLGEHPLVIRQSDGAKHVYLIGRYNRNANVTEDYTGTSSSAHNYVFEFGECLIPTKDHQVVLGRYNSLDGEASATLIVGDGTGESSSSRYNLLELVKKTWNSGNLSVLNLGNLRLSEKYIVTQNVDLSSDSFGRCYSLGYNNAFRSGSDYANNLYMFGHDLKLGSSASYGLQIILGKFNAQRSALLMLGNGSGNSSANRRNCFEIYDNHYTIPGTSPVEKVYSPEVGVGELWLSDTYVSNQHDFNPGDNGKAYVFEFGENNTVNQSSSHYRIKKSILFCSGCTFGTNVEFVNVFGGSNNEIGNYTEDSTIFGYHNIIPAGTSGDRRTNIYMFGHYLNYSHNKHITIGFYNDETVEQGDIFSIGNGGYDLGGDMHRFTVFGVGGESPYVYEGRTPYIRLGSTTINEDQFKTLKTLINAVPSGVKIAFRHSGDADIVCDGVTISTVESEKLYSFSRSLTITNVTGTVSGTRYDRNGASYSISSSSLTFNSADTLYLDVTITYT